MSNKQENLNEILNRFYEAGQVEQSADDIIKGEKLLRDNPAPEPDKQFVILIKSRVTEELAGRESRPVGRYARMAMTVAAVLVIAFGLLLVNDHTITEPVAEPVISQTIWESDDLTEDDAALAALVADIEAFEDEVFTLKFDENEADGISTDEIEIELMEISSNFWKG